MKVDFKWLYTQAKDERTKNFIKILEMKSSSVDRKDRFAVVSLKQKFPLILGKYKIWLNKENSVYSLDIYMELFRERHHGKLSSFLPTNESVIIDLGANEGYYVLKAKEFAPKSKIIAVEPNPTAFRILKKNVEANKLKNVILMNKAVTPRNGKIKFEVVKGRSEVGATKVYEKFRKKGRLKKIIVDSITLESLCKKYKIDKIDLLKIDVEGSEVDILKSSKNVLPKVERAIVEYHRAQRTKGRTIKLMINNNFKLLKIDDQKYYGDLYFIRNA
jgi:FkbM family methyltransferase